GSYLIDELQGELKLPGRERSGEIAKFSRTQDRGADGVLRPGGRELEIWMIKSVEGFRPELDVAGLAERNRLQEGKVDVLFAGTLEGIHADVAERSGLWVLK